MNGWFASAAALSAVTCAIHIIPGGREIARPLLASGDLAQVPKYTSYYCWHMVTITLAALAAAFGWAAADPRAGEAAIVATALSLAFAVWSLALIARFKLPPLQYPQWALFLPIAALGLAGSLN